MTLKAQWVLQSKESLLVKYHKKKERKCTDLQCKQSRFKRAGFDCALSPGTKSNMASNLEYTLAVTYRGATSQHFVTAAGLQHLALLTVR